MISGGFSLLSKLGLIFSGKISCKIYCFGSRGRSPASGEHRRRRLLGHPPRFWRFSGGRAAISSPNEQPPLTSGLWPTAFRPPWLQPLLPPTRWRGTTPPSSFERDPNPWPYALKPILGDQNPNFDLKLSWYTQALAFYYFIYLINFLFVLGESLTFHLQSLGVGFKHISSLWYNSNEFVTCSNVWI